MKKLSLLTLFVMASCSTAGPGVSPLFSGDFPPPGPPNYQQGMIDGCSTAIGAIGNAAFGAIHSGVHYDVDSALNDRVYYRAWKDGYFYCKYEHDKGPE